VFVQQPDSAVESKYKYVTEDDQIVYGNWCRPHLAVFNPTPSGPLYHYTSGSGLIEIIRSGELWSTQMACLNDSSELLYPIEFLHGKVRAKAKTSISREVDFLLRQIDQGLAEPTVDVEGRFIACFSEDGDDLSQWRAYGGGEGGYAIEFDSLYLRHQLQYLPPILGKVDYNQTQQSDGFFDDVLSHTIKFFLDGLEKKRAPFMELWAADFLRCWASYVIEFAPFIKHPKFSGEREWRLVYHFQDEAIPRQRYLQRSSMMTQHVPLRLMIGEDGHPRLPITGIVVGPSRHKEISKISVNDLLRTHGYTARASLTQIPYRAV
jgi:Protein of unknown function (DUF2971)